jgi:hypothetical protein
MPRHVQPRNSRRYIWWGNGGQPKSPGPGPPANGGDGWIASSTTSATNIGPHSKRSGVSARTAARPTSRCSVTACWRSPAAGLHARQHRRPAAPATQHVQRRVTGWLRRKRFDERAFLVHHLEITTALALRFPAVSDVETETRQTTGVSPLDPGPAGLRTRRTCTSPRARNVTRGGSGPSSRGRTRLYQRTTNRGS